jgi:colicin import membrane protein
MTHLGILEEGVEKDRVSLCIACIVIAIHIAILGCGTFLFKNVTHERSTPKKLVVHTVQLGNREKNHTPRENPLLSETVPAVSAVESVVIKEEASPQEAETQEVYSTENQQRDLSFKKEVPPQKKNSPKSTKKTSTSSQSAAVKKKLNAPSVKKAAPKAAASVKKSEVAAPVPLKESVKNSQAEEAAKAKRRSLLAEAQKNMNQLEESKKMVTTSSQTSSIALPGQIESLHIDGFTEGIGGKLNAQEMRYYEELASLLRRKLRLPEYGRVRIKLDLKRSGGFIHAEVLQTESKKNRLYLEQNLPTLSYPEFGNQFGTEDHYVFIIAFSNA